MLKRTIERPPEHIYPPDEWRIVEQRWPGDFHERAETIFSLSNGHLGIRGTFEEGRPGLVPGTFINGFHETWPIHHAENAFGFASTGQTIINAPDATICKLYVDDEPLFLPVANLREYRRVLDMRTGLLTRDLHWSTPSGKHVRVRSSRLVSLEHRHVVAMVFEVEMLSHDAPVVVSSQVVNRQDAALDDERNDRSDDPRLAKQFDHRVLRPVVADGEGTQLELGYQAANSRMTLGVVVDHEVHSEDGPETDTTVDGDHGRFVVSVNARPGHPLRIVKFASYQHSRSVPVPELLQRGRRTLARVMGEGVDRLLETQREQLDRFWDRADVRVRASTDGKRLQQAVRWNLFQLAQASWRAEGTGVPAKGLTGQAYDGHFFWDGEIYILPFITYTQPRIARNLLRFRHSMLDQARERARVLSQRGALFPWRTINGEEASAYYAAGTAQYHINADIAHAIDRYVNVRDDPGFLAEVGAEMLVETARLWEDLGFYRSDGRFSIHSVTGPDEYTTVVNDNVFTNLMARRNLRIAAAAVRQLQRERPDDHRALCHEVALADGEVEAWERAADAMYIPYDDDEGIHPQDDAFLEREVWDLEDTPPEKFPLLLHFHPLVIYRHQVIKQADVVLAMFLLGDEFTEEQKRRNFEYYDPLTTGDSSLSASVQSIVAAEIGDHRKALQYFQLALLVDLADVAGNVSDGVHVASCGGTWMALVFGFGGMRDDAGGLSFRPHLPRGWSELEFSVRYRDRQLRVSLSHAEERYLIDDGDPLEITVRDDTHRLEPGVPLVLGRHDPDPVRG